MCLLGIKRSQAACFLSLASSAGDCLGELRTNGPQMLHGRRSNPVGGAGPELDGDWLVQAVPYLLHGGPEDGATHPPLLSDVSGEHHRAVLRPTLMLGQNPRLDAVAQTLTLS